MRPVHLIFYGALVFAEGFTFPSRTIALIGALMWAAGMVWAALSFLNFMLDS